MGVVAVASAGQLEGEGGVLGQGAHRGCLFGRFGVGVPVAGPLGDVAAVPRAGCPCMRPGPQPGSGR